jgi:hypothetical protein
MTRIEGFLGPEGHRPAALDIAFTKTSVGHLNYRHLMCSQLDDLLIRLEPMGLELRIELEKLMEVPCCLPVTDISMYFR